LQGLPQLGAAPGREQILGPVCSAEFSPDGRRVLVVSRMTKAEDVPFTPARVFDAATGKELFGLAAEEYPVQSAACSPDGTRILTAEGRNGGGPTTARLFDAATGRELLALAGHEGDIRSAVFSPDGRRVYTAARAARLWDSRTGQELATFDPQWAPAL